jgi:hypothetical protein
MVVSLKKCAGRFLPEPLPVVPRSGCKQDRQDTKAYMLGENVQRSSYPDRTRSSSRPAQRLNRQISKIEIFLIGMPGSWLQQH